MCIEALLPVEACVAHHRVLLRGQGALLVVVRASEAADVVAGRTVQGDVEHLVGVHQVVAEVLADGESAVDLVLRRDGEVEHGVLKAVLVLALRVFQDGCGVAQSPVVVVVAGHDLVEIALACDVELRVGEAAGAGLVVTVAVGAHEGRLDVGQERGVAGRAFFVARGSTIAAQVARDIAERGVEADIELLRQRDVGVETHVEAAHAVLLHRALRIAVAHRQVVVGHVVTTLDIDAIVLRDGGVVDVVLPVGVLVILVVIEIGGILVEELELADGGVGGVEHLGDVAAILPGIHHRHKLGFKHCTC